jgi:hypothetical protein
VHSHDRTANLKLLRALCLRILMSGVRRWQVQLTESGLGLLLHDSLANAGIPCRVGWDHAQYCLAV